MVKHFYTTHEVSRFCEVYPTTVIHWIRDGLLPAHTTPGGHRRIKREDILALMKKNNMPIPDGLKKSERGRVLVIDDDPKILRMTEMILLEEDLEVKVATSGFEAGFMLTNWLPDIIVLDLRMPDMDGFEVCRRLKAEERTKDIPIIVSTVMKDTETVAKMESCCVSGHIFKPFKSEDLVKKIKEHLSV